MEPTLLDKLTAWVADQLPDANGCELAPLAGDAGTRRYFRIAGAPQRLAVYAPPAAENSRRFAALCEALRAQGVHAPRVYAADYERGFLLIDYLGDRLYLNDLNAGTVEALYGEALVTLLQLQQIPPLPETLGDYDRTELTREMDLFPHWFVAGLLGYELNASEQLMLRQLFNRLCDSALEQPQCFVHRDYHSRNLIHRTVGPPGVIDFQDALRGPVTYDLVSLLRDCYVRWPAESVERWALAYANMAVEVGVLPAVSGRQFLHWFDWMGLQRHLKVLGIFSRLDLRDGKSAYLRDLPLVIRYTLTVADRYPEFKVFAGWFRDKLLPLAAQRDWYLDYRTAGYSPLDQTA